MKISEVPNRDYVKSGGSCSGCGMELALRLTLRELGKKTIICTTPGCLSGTSSITLSRFNTAFPATAATAAGMSRGLKSKNLDHVTVLAIGGDGGTADIGFQGLSGIIERDEDLLYICYDNEAYMNTGYQRSSTTPQGAKTSTTPVGAKSPTGKREKKKDVLRIIMSHDIQYAASASIGYPLDYLEKVRKAKEKKGTRYVQVLTPCPVGWGFASEKTIEVAKLAVETGSWILAEKDDGKFRLDEPTKGMLLGEKDFTPLKDYIDLQKRFDHLTESKIKELEEMTRENLKEYVKFLDKPC